MINFIILLSLLAIVMVACFWGVCYLVMLWTGCSLGEAKQKIYRFTNPDTLPQRPYQLASDSFLIAEIWESVRNIVGENRYTDLERLSYSSSLFESGYASGLPYIAITVPYTDDNEKIRLENVLKNLLINYLTIHNISPVVIVDWKKNWEIKLPVLMLRYSETPEQEEMISKCIDISKGDIIKKYSPCLDDEEDLYV